MGGLSFARTFVVAYMVRLIRRVFTSSQDDDDDGLKSGESLKEFERVPNLVNCEIENQVIFFLQALVHHQSYLFKMKHLDCFDLDLDG